MKQQLTAAYRTASRHFIEIVKRNNSNLNTNDIRTVLVPTDQNRTAVCIIMKTGVYVFQPSKEYHKTKRNLGQVKPKHRPLSPARHAEVCSRTIDKLFELYRQQAQERLKKGYSRLLTEEEKKLLHARRFKTPV